MNDATRTNCLEWVTRASAGGHAFWDYHQSYQSTLDELAAEGAIVHWGGRGQSFAHVYQPWYLEACGFWTREGFIERVTRVIYWMERAAEMSHRESIVAHMADWVCALVDIDRQLTTDHHSDAACINAGTVDAETGDCSGCGCGSGPACSGCGGIRYHNDGCDETDDARADRRLTSYAEGGE